MDKIFLDDLSLQENPISDKLSIRGVMTFRDIDETDFPQKAKYWLLKDENAQKTKDKDIQRDFPERIAPSQITASKELYLLYLDHQFKSKSCLGEKDLKLFIWKYQLN